MNKRPLNIMIAENDEDDRALVRFAFAECKLSNIIHFVEDGEQLLDYLYHRGAYQDTVHLARPDLILLDLEMPRMNGHEALREIKSDPQLRSIPVVIFTTSKSANDINSTYNMGANSFIIKPVTYDGLIQVMNVLAEYWAEITELPLVSR
jgi:CheY-like chemotaxis protein